MTKLSTLTLKKDTATPPAHNTAGDPATTSRPFLRLSRVLYDIDTAVDLESIRSAYLELTKSIGVAYFALISLEGPSPADDGFQPEALYTNVPQPLAELIRGAGRAANFPLIRLVGRSAEPLRLSSTDETRGRRTVQPLMTLIGTLLGPGDILVIPVHRDDTLRGYGFALAPASALDPVNCSMLHLATNVAILRACDLSQRHISENEALTGRELACVREAAYDRSNKEIARALEISERTVRFHLDNAKRKLAVATRRLVVKKARESGLVSSDQN